MAEQETSTTKNKKGKKQTKNCKRETYTDETTEDVCTYGTVRINLGNTAHDLDSDPK